MAALYDYPTIVPQSREQAEEICEYLEIIPDLPKRNNKKHDKCPHGNALKASNQSKKQWKPFIILIATLCLSVMLLAAILLLIATSHGINKKQGNTSLNNSSTDIGTQVAQQLQAHHFAQRSIHVGLIRKARQNKNKITKVSESLSSLNNTIVSTANMMNDVLMAVKELLLIRNRTSSSGPSPISCQDIKKRQPSSPSGHYNINGTSIYCNMEELCGSGGGWTRLAYLNMNDSTVNCPSGFRLYQSGGVRACGRPVRNDGGYASVQFPSNGIEYSQICGRVVGYQYATTDAMRKEYRILHNVISSTINGSYVDGVSITRGSSRQHVWTFASGSTDTGTGTGTTCHCTDDNKSFISHYFCESGNHEGSNAKYILYTSDPLWDGQGCGSNEVSCCSAPGIPWFHRDYGNTTSTDYIELRVCGDQGTDNEDVPVGQYEIYVK